MCFSDFPTETTARRCSRCGSSKGWKEDLSLFILGRFDLTHGSLVAQRPATSASRRCGGSRGTSSARGSSIAERRRPKSPEGAAKLEEAVSASYRAVEAAPLPVGRGALHGAHDALVRPPRQGRVPPAGRACDSGSRRESARNDARFDVERVTALGSRERGGHLGRARSRRTLCADRCVPRAGRRAPPRAPLVVAVALALRRGSRSAARREGEAGTREGARSHERATAVAREQRAEELSAAHYFGAKRMLPSSRLVQYT